jgi:hypothetical protein
VGAVGCRADPGDGARRVCDTTRRPGQLGGDCYGLRRRRGTGRGPDAILRCFSSTRCDRVPTRDASPASARLRVPQLARGAGCRGWRDRLRRRLDPRCHAPPALCISSTPGHRRRTPRGRGTRGAQCRLPPRRHHRLGDQHSDGAHPERGNRNRPSASYAPRDPVAITSGKPKGNRVGQRSRYPVSRKPIGLHQHGQVATVRVIRSSPAPDRRRALHLDDHGQHHGSLAGHVRDHLEQRVVQLLLHEVGLGCAVFLALRQDALHRQASLLDQAVAVLVG